MLSQSTKYYLEHYVRGLFQDRLDEIDKEFPSQSASEKIIEILLLEANDLATELITILQNSKKLEKLLEKAIKEYKKNNKSTYSKK